jgi:AcrR family transcriptional regulator
LKNKEKGLEYLPTVRLVLDMHTTTTKEQLIQKMLMLGSEKGLNTISLGALAQEQGISKAAIFHHFANREALIDALFSHCSTLAYSLTAKISLEGDAKEVLTRAVQHWLDVYEEPQMRDFYRIIETEALIHPKAQRIKKTLDEMLQGQSFVLLETLSSTGRLLIEDLDFAVITFSCAMQRFLERTLLEETEDIDWEIHRFLQQFCKHYNASLHG